MNNRKEKNHNDNYRFFFLVFCCLLFTVYCLLASCGKKGEPTLKSYEKPLPPSGLRAVHRESELILTWDFPKDKETVIKGFHLLKSSDGDFDKIAFLANDRRSYTDRDFKTGSQYQYKIVSRNLRDVTSNDSNIIKVTPEALPPPPSNISFKIDHDSLMLTWNSTGEGVVYNIYKSDKKGTYSLTPVNKELSGETFFRDVFSIQKPVYYTLRSSRGSAVRDEGPASDEIAIDPQEFLPSAPEALQAVAVKEYISLIWKEPPETWVTGYRVYREMEREGFMFIGETKTPSFVDRDNPSMKRNYQVTAIGPSKEGPPAEIKNVFFTEPK